MKQIEIVLTEDGSNTLRVPDLNEHYHSTFGAIAESRHIFIEAGLKYVMKNEPVELNILEVGFGTGLNALLTMLWAGSTGNSINYTTIEKYPLIDGLWDKLNYPEQLEDARAYDYFKALHECTWNENHKLLDNFNFIKKDVDLETYQNPEASFDLIYFDAFGPDVQPNLWTEEIFNKIAKMTAKGGVLVTYSCKGTVKRALKATGFKIEKIPGPKGKREILRGVRF